MLKVAWLSVAFYTVRVIARARAGRLIGWFICLLALAGLLAVSIHIPQASAASYTWNGGGTDGTCGGQAGDGNKWSCAANWSGGVVPTSADNVTFSGTSTKNAVVDSGFAGVVTNLTVSSGYTGIISLSRNLTLNGNYSQAGGTLTAGNYDLTITGTFGQSAGTFTAPSTNLTWNSTVNLSGGTFNHNNGVIVITGTATFTITCTGAAFNRVTPNWTSGTKTVAASCTLPLGTNPTVSGPISVAGTLSGSGTLELAAASNNQLSAGAVLSGFTGLVVQNSLNIYNTFNASAYTVFDINAGLGINNTAVFTAPAYMTIAANLTIASGAVFNHNNGTIVFDGTGSGTINCDTAIFYRVVFGHSGATKTVSANCTIPLGANPTLSGSVSSAGVLTGSGTLNVTGGLSINGSVNGLVGFSGLVTSVNFSSGGSAVTDLSSYSVVDINGSFTQSGGIFTAPSGDMTVALSFTISSGVFNHNNGRVIFDGASNGTLSCNNIVFNRVLLAHTGGTTNIGANCQLPLGHNPSSSTILNISGTLTGTGTWTNTSTIYLNPGSVVAGFDVMAISGSSTTMNINTSLDATAMTAIDANGSMIIGASADLVGPPQMYVGASLTVTPGAIFTSGNTILTMDGTSNGTMSCNTATFAKVVFSHTASTRTVNSDCSLPLGIDPSISGAVTLNGIISGSGLLSLYHNMTINAGGGWQGFSGYRQEMGTFTLNGGVFDASHYSPFFLHSYFIQNDGTFIAPPILEVVSRFQLLGGTFVHNNGTVVFNRYDGSNSTIAIQCTGNPFYLVSFAEFSYNPTSYQVNPGCTLPLGNNPHLAVAGTGTTFTIQGTLQYSGTLYVSANLVLDSPQPLVGGQAIVAEGELLVVSGLVDLSGYSQIEAAALTVNGGSVVAPPAVKVSAFTVSGGEIDMSQSAVALSGNEASVVVGVPEVRFNQIRYTPDSQGTLTVGGGQPFGVSDLLEIVGPAQVVSASPGQQAVINMAGPRHISQTSFKDISNSNGVALALAGAGNQDKGNNSGMDFDRYAVEFSSLAPTDQATVTTARPIFSWTAATDRAMAAISSYSLKVINGQGVVFELPSLPVSSHANALYDLHLEGNSFSLTTKPSASWPSGFNNGQLKAGSQTWQITATDAVGNSRVLSRMVNYIAKAGNGVTTNGGGQGVDTGQDQGNGGTVSPTMTPTPSVVPSGGSEVTITPTAIPTPPSADRGSTTGSDQLADVVRLELGGLLVAVVGGGVWWFMVARRKG